MIVQLCPCPFCGSPACFGEGADAHFVFCSSRQCAGTTVSCGVEMWNERADTHAAEVARLTAAGQALRDATDVLVVGGDPQVGGSPELIRAMNAWDAIAPAARKETKDQ